MTTIQFSRRTCSAICLLALAFVLEGCTVMAVRTAVNVYRSVNSEKATTEVAASPREIYEAELKDLAAMPDAVIVSQDPENFVIEARIGNDSFKSQVVQTDGGNSLFISEVFSEDDLGPDESPAVDFERSVLDRLNIDYDIVGE